MNKEQEYEMFDINRQLNDLAQNGESQAQYTYGKELLSVVRNEGVTDRKQEKQFLSYAYD